jgi:hypothetical protein
VTATAPAVHGKTLRIMGVLPPVATRTKRSTTF